MIARLRYLLSRPLGDQWLVTQTAVVLGVSRFAIRSLRFRHLERLLGQRLTESSDSALADSDLQHVRRVAWAVGAVSNHTPWTSNCFPQALTAKLLLRRRGLDSTLYIGAAFAEGRSALEAHAWLRCGPIYVTGGDGSSSFGAIVSYS